MDKSLLQLKKVFGTLKQYFVLIIEYVQQNMKYLLFLIILTNLCYGSKLVFGSNQFDTIQMYANYERTIDWWLALGRFSLVFMKRIFENGILSVYFSNFLTMLFFVIAALSWSFLFSTFTPLSFKRGNWVLGGLFISTPIMAEQISFSLQNWEVMTGFAVVPIAIYLFFAGDEERNFYSMFLSAFLLAWTIGLYQNFLSIYVLGFLSVLLFKIDEIISYKQIIILCLKFVITFLIGIGLYFCISITVQKIYDIEPVGYLFDNVMWTKRSIIDSVYQIMKYTKGLIFSSQNYYSSILYGIVWILFLMESFFVKSVHRIWNFGIRILILISPFYFSILFGDGLLLRVQTVLPLTFSIVGWYLYCSVSDMKRIKTLCAGILAIIILRHSQILVHAFYSDYCAYNQDVILSQQIRANINTDFPENTSDKIIFINKKSKTTFIPNNIFYENIGTSIYSIEWLSDYDRNTRLADFYNYLGYPTSYVSPDEFGRYISMDYSNMLSKRYQEYIIYSLEGVSIVQFY